MNMLRMCMNWKVIAGLAVFAAGLFVFASPTASAVAFPFLLAAICPLSMVFMMRGMGQMKKEPQGTGTASAGAGQDPCCSSSQPLTRDEQVTALQHQLSSIRAQQDLLAAQLSELDSPKRAMDFAPVTAARPSH